MNSITLKINNEYNLSNIKINTIIRQVQDVLIEVHEYASSRLFNEVGISLDTISNFDRLCQTYQNDRICMFTGAGVSFTESKYYRTSGWWDLLMEIYGIIHPTTSDENLTSAFNELREQYSKPWQMASYLENKAGSDRFTEILRQIFYLRSAKKDSGLRPIAADKDKRLPIAYLNHASTLNAAIAFCSKIRAIRKHPCYIKNEKIHAVLTLNYDCFLEAGATQKYNAGRFKPRVTNEPPDRENQLPVYHIHGYIPYGGRKPAHKLILTEESYKNAYEKGGKAREIIDEFLGRFAAIFIGVSFDDELLLQRLEYLAKNDRAKHHFALLNQGVSKDLLKRLVSVKVFPILYSCHEQIPMILRHIYQTMLSDTLNVNIEAKTDEKFQKVGKVKLSKDEYWELLLFNKK